MEKHFGCIGNTIRLRSGIYFDFCSPTKEMVNMMDIAGALSKICRFGGQTDQFYSVAEHCVLCSFYGQDQDAKDLLLHDAAEAYCGDMVKPLKIMLPGFSEIEKRIESVIQEKYQVNFKNPMVKMIDHGILIAEKKKCFSPDAVKWTDEEQAVGLSPKIMFLNPSQAEIFFLDRARQLGFFV